MTADLISSLKSSDLKEFKKDFVELMRVNVGINKEYGKMSKYIDKAIPQYKQTINLFNKKYKNIFIKLKKGVEELKVRIFIKEKSVKDVFTNAASKFSGLKAIGANTFGAAPIEEIEKFSKELEKLKDKLVISYYEQGAGSSTIFLEYTPKSKMVEINYNQEGIANEKSPEFKLCAYYAVKDGIKKIDIHERLAGIGFCEVPSLDKARKSFSKFHPMWGE